MLFVAGFMSWCIFYLLLFALAECCFSLQLLVMHANNTYVAIRFYWHDTKISIRALLLSGRCFKCFVLPVLEYCSAVWCSTADTHLKLLGRVVSGASFLTGGVFEGDFAHRRSVTVLCMLYKIRCNPLHPLSGSHIGTLMCLLAAEPHSIAWLLFPFRCLCGTNLVTPYSMVWDWRVTRAGQMPFYWSSCYLPFVSSWFPFLFFHSMGWYYGTASCFQLVSIWLSNFQDSETCVRNLDSVLNVINICINRCNINNEWAASFLIYKVLYGIVLQ